jgi:uncharacterized membrane protein
MDQLVFAGTVIVIIGIALIFIGAALSSERKTDGKTEVRWGFGGFIGFIPFGFASDRNMLYITIGLIAAMATLFLVTRKVG